MGDAKAEAERLCDIGARYFHQGNTDKARQFLERANKLHSSQQIRGTCTVYSLWLVHMFLASGNTCNWTFVLPFCRLAQSDE